VTQDYRVLRAFETTEAISGRKRRFEPGAAIKYDTGQAGPTVTIEADLSLFLVDRSTFETCCKPNYEGGSAF
jgi:hypothetical protein